MYRLLLIKRFIEDIFIFPFILVGRLTAALRPLKKDYRVFFFFPFYHTGGAEKVHAQVAAATGGNDCIIFFTKRSVDDRFLNDFKKTGCEIRDISSIADNKWLYFLNLYYRGIISGYINSQTKKPIVFNGQCNFGYKISRWIKKDIPQIELIHSLNTFSFIRIPFLPFITKTVMISKKRIDDHKGLYNRMGIPSSFLDKIVYIPNAIDIPGQPPPKNGTHLKVLFVGRATEEKRVMIFARIAERLKHDKDSIQFEIAGDVSDSFPEKDFPFIKYYGNVKSDEELRVIYSNAHVLILTSSTEGFPLVIMEAMASGCVILSTAVGDIPYHVKENQNGFLFSDTGNKEQIIDEALEKLVWLKNNRDELERMASNNIQYARHNFGIERLNNDYQELFSSIN